MTSRLSSEHFSMWRSFIEAYSSVMRTLEQAMQDEHGVPLTWFDVLLHLEEAPEGRLRLGCEVLRQPQHDGRARGVVESSLEVAVVVSDDERYQ